MKSATLPPIRSAVAKRENQAKFIGRGIAAIEATKRDGVGFPLRW